MARIEDANPKKSSGGYRRLVGDNKVADVLQKAHSTVIANGNELEKIVTDMAQEISDLDAFLQQEKSGQLNPGIYLCSKKVIKKSSFAHQGKIEPDFLIFSLNGSKTYIVLELKDGDIFDTKKAQGEKDNLVAYTNFLGARIQFSVDYKICCFNQDKKEEIVRGFKKKFTQNEVLTGKELAKILNIDYAQIIK